MVHKIPLTISNLLTMEGSLTEYVKRYFKNVEVKLLRQQWSMINSYGIEDQQGIAAVIREVVMLVDGVNGWYARTIIPQATYQLRARQFDNLGSRPLADILFNDPEITRQNLTIENIAEDQLEYVWALKFASQPHNCNALWARRSTFKIASSPLYLVEILLPTLINRISC